MKVENLTKVLEFEISNYRSKLEVKNIGYVLQAGDGIAKIYGLSEVMSGERIEFESRDVCGMALNLEEGNVGVILFGDIDSLKEGDRAISSGRLFTIPVGEEVLGRVLSPLGEPIDSKGAFKIEEEREIERDAPAMFKREKVSIPLETGIQAIDGLIPIGRGQRELIIGDRHTGKTSIAIDTILNQRDKDVISIYVSIGQRQSSLARIVNLLEERGSLKSTVIISASASDSASLQYIAPYAGCAIAEYFMERGRDVLIVYDDLSKHAVSYREISLLLRRPPGREAYPGDIFFIHSKLLERAAMLKRGSLTALPIVETLSGDVSAYIPTNIISITDGQIYLESSLFNSGIKPSINPGLSVSRVGGDAQISAMKRVSSSIKIALAQYREVANFAQFSSDMDLSTKRQIERGKRVVELLKQDRSSPLSTATQVVLFYAVINNYLDEVDLSKIALFKREVDNIVSTKEEFKSKIRVEGLSESVESEMRGILEAISV